ncbi:MAG: hypothetical protein RMK99_05800 [Anaerolineales bacterium]|nr:hypothetical protein [Anaerolineales bacterium]
MTPVTDQKQTSVVRPPIWRFLLMALAMLILLAALWAALVRLGWQMPALPLPLAGQHGALMISGFLGALISLERAVALGWRWAYAPPALAGLGALALVSGLPLEAGRGLLTLAAFGLSVVSARLLRRHPVEHVAVMALGALAWLVGNVLWLGRWPLQQAVVWWVGFLTLTIAGERLELGRLLRPSRSVRLSFRFAVGVFLAGAALSPVSLEAGWRVAGAGLLLLGLWLAWNDIARFTVRQAGLTRYIAVCLLAGYVWLMAGGGLWLGFGAQPASRLLYDAMLHSLLLGFVFSMIFGHAPIIFPGLLGRSVVYAPVFYAPLLVLHAALLVRVAGDLFGDRGLHMWGGLFNVLAIPLFLVLLIGTLLRSRRMSQS